MENRIEGAVKETVGQAHTADSVAETPKEWVAPELRKFEIAEVTSANVTVNAPDGSLAS